MVFIFVFSAKKPVVDGWRLAVIKAVGQYLFLGNIHEMTRPFFVPIDSHSVSMLIMVNLSWYWWLVVEHGHYTSWSLWVKKGKDWTVNGS